MLLGSLKSGPAGETLEVLLGMGPHQLELVGGGVL